MSDAFWRLLSDPVYGIIHPVFNNAMCVRGTHVTDMGPRRTLKEIIMAYQITDKCVACGICKDACPVEAINEGSPIFTIDSDKCVDCGACAGECPNEAIIAG